MQIEPGIYDLSAADYHSLPHLSRSTIHTLLTKSPAHAKAGMADEQNGAMALGSVWHNLVLGKGDAYVVSPYDEYRTKEARTWRDEQIKAGLTPIKPAAFESAQAMAERLTEQLGHHEIGDPFEAPGQSEAVVIWQDQGVDCRAMIDRLPLYRHALYDLKSSESAATDAFQRTAFQHGYHLQAGFYTRGLAAITGRDPIEIPFRFVVQESSPPHFVNVIEMSGEALLMAEEQIEKALKIWKRCTESGKWPSYGHFVQLIDPPGYALKNWEFQRALDSMEQAT